MTEGQTPKIPTDDEIRLIICQTMEQMFLQAKASEKLLLNLGARVEAMTPIVDSNQADAQTARAVAAQKEIISHLYERAQQYVAVIVAGAFAAYFATLSVIAPRMPDYHLILSALFMTASLSVFVLFEVFSISFTAYRIFRGDVDAMKPSRIMLVAWGAALLFSIGTALPAIGLSVWAYLRGLGALP